jgi:hypothetical protein
MAKKRNNEQLNGTEEFENPFTTEPDIEIEIEYNRAQLEALSGKELAILAGKYTDKKETTLKSMSKTDLATIILNKGEEKKETFARAPRSQTEAAELIDDFITLFDDIKMERELREGKNAEPNKRYMKGAFKRNAITTIDKKMQDGTINFSNFNGWLALLFGVIICWSSIVGMGNTKKFYSKMYKTFFGERNENDVKKDKKANDETANKTNENK